MATHLKAAIANNTDPQTVREGAPAYLIMLDSLLEKDPDNVEMLCSAATLNAFYADIFVEDQDRSRRLTDKALDLAMKAVCIDIPELCTARRMEFDQFEKQVQMVGKDHVEALFTLGAGWAGWIQAHHRDWNAVAEISRVELIMRRVLELDSSHQDGMPHLYLGVVCTILPEALGGKPEQGRQHFEKAIDLSHGKNLMAKVLFARQYARLVFDRDLHDKLLNEVLIADVHAQGYVLSNRMAQVRAKALMESAGDYF